MSQVITDERIHFGASDYAWQKFFEALRYAVASTAPLQQRLATLVWEVYDLRQQDFPDPDTWLRFQDFLTATGAIPAAAAKSNIVASTFSMTDAQAGKWLQEAVQIFSSVADEEVDL